MSIDEKYYKEFCEAMNSMTRSYDASRVFNDLLTLSICSLHQINLASGLTEKDPENEAQYFDTIKSYTTEELKIFSRLLGLVQLNVYHNPYSDLLGEYFTEFITRGENGQFFTPSSICTLIAKINGTDKNPIGKKVLDPACGSGRLLLQFAKAAPDNYFFANDISLACAKMTTVNFMLNGLRGEVACMNTLSMEWFCGWLINIPSLGIAPVEKEKSRIWSAPIQSKEEPQLTLF